jgi:hypothetical protein
MIPPTEKAMRKLRLDVETLNVQSFDTAVKDDERGTVLGASVASFQPWGDCSDTCTEATQPAAACYSVPGEVCPQQPPAGTGTSL